MCSCTATSLLSPLAHKCRKALNRVVGASRAGTKRRILEPVCLNVIEYGPFDLWHPRQEPAMHYFGTIPPQTLTARRSAASWRPILPGAHELSRAL
jgi:hypothetical protein